MVVGKRCVPKISSTQDGTIGLDEAFHFILHEATYSRVQNLLFLSFLHSILLLCKWLRRVFTRFSSLLLLPNQSLCKKYQGNNRMVKQ